MNKRYGKFLRERNYNWRSQKNVTQHLLIAAFVAWFPVPRKEHLQVAEEKRPEVEKMAEKVLFSINASLNQPCGITLATEGNDQGVAVDGGVPETPAVQPPDFVHQNKGKCM